MEQLQNEQNDAIRRENEEARKEARMRELANPNNINRFEPLGAP